MKRCPEWLVVVWFAGVVALVLLAGVGVARGDTPGETCVSGHQVRGHTVDRVVVPLDRGLYTVTVRTWDEYPGRETAGRVGQESERITVAGRTTPDLADGVARPEWSDTWTWTSPGRLDVVHEHGGSGWQSLWFEACATPVPAPTTTTTTTTTVPVLEPDAGPATDTPVPEPVPVEVLPETVAAEPVKARPAFTG